MFELERTVLTIHAAYTILLTVVAFTLIHHKRWAPG